MAFIEHHAGGALGMVAAPGGIDHDQRMVGDHQVGLGAGSGSAFDEALPVVGTTGIDAFAALVGERTDRAGAKQRAEPAGQVAADHVAILRIGGPARYQLRQDCRPPAEAALQGVLQVEQAQVVLATLADHHRAAAVGPLVRPGTRAFAAQLALEVLGVGRDPYGAAGSLCPQRGRGEVAECLADPGSGLRQQHVRCIPPGAGREDARDFAGIVALAFAPFCALAGQVHQSRIDGLFFKPDLRRLGPLCCFLPFGKPCKEPLLRLSGPLHMRREDAGPGPAQAGERLQRAPCALPLGPVGTGTAGHQCAGGLLQEARHIVIARRFGQGEGMGEASRRGHAEPRRMDEGEQFQQIQPGQVGIAEPRCHQRRVEQQQRRIGRSHHRLSLAHAGSRFPTPQPATGMAGVQRG